MYVILNTRHKIAEKYKNNKYNNKYNSVVLTLNVTLCVMHINIINQQLWKE